MDASENRRRITLLQANEQNDKLATNQAVRSIHNSNEIRFILAQEGTPRTGYIVDQLGRRRKLKDGEGIV